MCCEDAWVAYYTYQVERIDMATVEGPVVATTTLPLSHGNTAVFSPRIVEATPTTKPTPQSRPAFEIEEHPIDQVRPIKVGVIGAGLAGVNAGILLPAKLPGLDLRIYDKNADVVCYVANSKRGLESLTDDNRVALGLKTPTPACDATFQPTSTSQASHPTRNGPRSLLKARRSATIGRAWRASTTSTSIYDFSNGSRRPSGFPSWANGVLPCGV